VGIALCVWSLSPPVEGGGGPFCGERSYLVIPECWANFLYVPWHGKVGNALWQVDLRENLKVQKPMVTPQVFYQNEG
jgi:hypothetical protein